MVSEGQHAKAAALRALHGGGIFVLPNAWDAGSAVMIAAAGAQAIATTSAGVSWSLGAAGRPEPGPTGRPLARLARIAAAVDLPVTADIESGYGNGRATSRPPWRAVIEAGAVGINIEDSGAPGGGLFDPAAQAARIPPPVRPRPTPDCPSRSSTPAPTCSCSRSASPKGASTTCWPAPPPTQRRARTACSCPACSTWAPSRRSPARSRCRSTSWSAPERPTSRRSRGRRAAGQPRPGDHPGRVHPGPQGGGRGAHRRNLRRDRRRRLVRRYQRGVPGPVTLRQGGQS